MISRFPGETSRLSLAWAVMDLVIAGGRGLGLTLAGHHAIAALVTARTRRRSSSRWPNIALPGSLRRQTFPALLGRDRGLQRMTSSTRLSLTLGCGAYDRTRALADGSIHPPGTRFEFVALPPSQLFKRELSTGEFDVSEFSLSHLIMLASRADERFVGLPIFTSKIFRHSAIYVRHESRITKPEMLVGKRVGVPDYTITAAVWVRGLLQHEYGVHPTSIDWYWGGLNEPDGEQRLTFRRPLELRLTKIRGGSTLDSMLVAGDLDAVISPRVPNSYLALPSIKRLFRDYKREEVEYYRRTRLFPIMHCVVLRSDLYRRHPWLAAALYEAFTEAKEACRRTLFDTGAAMATLVWLHAQLEEEGQTFGGDPWSYGIQANRHSLDAILQYCHEQGLADRHLAVENIFAPEVHAT